MRRILPILVFLLVASVSLYAQSSSRPALPQPAPGDKIVNLYPNPATSYITFDLQKTPDRSLSLEIFSFLGKKMTEIKNINSKNTIDLTDYNRGLYMYQLVDASGKIVESGKFQVTK